MTDKVTGDRISGDQFVSGTEVQVASVQVFILMTDHGIDVVTAEILVVGQQLLGVDDAAVVGLDTQVAGRRGTSGDVVHVHVTAPVRLIHVEVDVEVEILQEMDVGKQTAGPCRNVLGLDVGLGHIQEVRTEDTVRMVVGTQRRERIVIDVEDLLSVSVEGIIAVRVDLENRHDGLPSLDLEHGVSGGAADLTGTPLTGLGARARLGVGHIGADFQPGKDLGVHVDTAAETLEGAGDQVGRIGLVTQGSIIMELLAATVGGDIVFLAESLLEHDVLDVIGVKQGSRRIDLTRSRIDQVGALHCGAGIGSVAGIDIDRTGNVVSHVVAERILLERSLAAGIVEEVLAGEQTRFLIAVVRRGDIGIVETLFINAGDTGALHAVTVRVVDTLPCVLIVFGCRINGVGVVVTDGVEAPAALEGDLGLAFGTALGGDQDDTVTGTGTIQGGGSRILEDGHGSDIVGIQLRQRVLIGGVGLLRDTVDDDQRCGGSTVRGADTTEADSHIITGLSVNGSHLQTRGGTFQCTGNRGRVLDGNDVRFDFGQGTGHVLPFLGAISNNDNIVERKGILLEDDVKLLAVTDQDFLGLETDRRENEGSLRPHREGEVAIQVRYYASPGALDLDTGTDDGFTLCVNDLTGHCRLGKCCRSQRKERQHNHKKSFYHNNT